MVPGKTFRYSVEVTWGEYSSGLSRLGMYQPLPYSGPTIPWHPTVLPPEYSR
jgi:hypothetical protein